MASRRGNRICVLFEKTPKGSSYKKGRYSFVKETEAKELIDKGYGKEYDPDKTSTPAVKSPAKSTSKTDSKSKDDKK